MTGPNKKQAKPTLGRSATAEDLKKHDGWQIGTVYRVDPTTGRVPIAGLRLSQDVGVREGPGYHEEVAPVEVPVLNGRVLDSMDKTATAIARK